LPIPQQDHFQLIRLAARNVGRRRLRAILLPTAVMLGVGVGYAGFVLSAVWHLDLTNPLPRYALMRRYLLECRSILRSAAS
jgi:hypothetical protein